jgi:predicted RNase H-like HicB family nuclease
MMQAHLVFVEERAMKFKVQLFQSEEGYAVGALGLPGCWSQGETEAEALENIAICIREYLDSYESPEEGWQVREVEVA